MKKTFGLIPCLLLSALVELGAVSQAKAVPQCVVTDVGVQIAVHGSRRPAEQINDVEVQSTESCSGNTSTSVGTQVHVGGTGTVRQERRARHRIQGQGQELPEYGRNGQTMVIPVEVQVDVDNPADRLRH